MSVNVIRHCTFDMVIHVPCFNRYQLFAKRNQAISFKPVLIGLRLLVATCSQPDCGILQINRSVALNTMVSFTLS